MAQPGETGVSTRFRTARILHGAMVVTLLVYAGIVHLLQQTGWSGRAAADALPLIRWILYALGAAEFLVVLVARSRALSAEGLEDAARRGGAEAALGLLQTRLVVLLALAESVAIYGLVLFLLGGSLRDFYVLWAAGLVAQLVLTPRRELWDEVARGAPRH